MIFQKLRDQSASDAENPGIKEEAAARGLASESREIKQVLYFSWDGRWGGAAGVCGGGGEGRGERDAVTPEKYGPDDKGDIKQELPQSL